MKKVLLSLLLLCGVILLATSVGAVRLSSSALVDAWLHRSNDLPTTILWTLRLPRVVLAVVLGASLSLAGATFQALLRNPLAEPYILGVSGGAATGAVLAIAFGASLSMPSLTVAAFLGALLAILTVYRVARVAGNALDTRILLLAGVVAGVFFNAVIALVMTRIDANSALAAIRWMLGSFSGATWGTVAILTGVTVLGGAVLIALSRDFDRIALGDETAATLGTEVDRTKRIAFLVSSFMVASSVAACGVIGFVGLVVPHTVRLLVGSGHRRLLPLSAIGGGIFLVLADAVARSVIAPIELPVGVVTAFVGVPFFLLLLRRRAARAK